MTAPALLKYLGVGGEGGAWISCDSLYRLFKVSASSKKSAGSFPVSSFAVRWLRNKHELAQYFTS